MKNLLAERVLSIQESSTFAMSRRAKEMIAQGIDIINLSVGEPDFKTPKFIQEHTKSDIDTQNYFNYPPSSGYKDLKESIVKKFRKQNNINCTLDQIVVTNGAKQAISDVFLSILNPGDEVIIFAPFWVSYSEMVKLSEGDPVILHTNFENNYKISPEQFEKAITPKTKAFIYSSPCNPSGAVLNKEDLNAIRNIMLKHKNLIAISDEIYEHINFTNNHYSLGAFEDISHRVVTINGFSKAFAMTGWRLGYLCAPNFIAEACSKLHDQISFGACTISQRAGLAALSAPLEKIQYMIDAYKERRDTILKIFNNDFPNIKVNNPEGAFYFFPDFSYYFDKSYNNKKINNSLDLSFYLLEEAKVATVAGDGFGNPECIRLSFAASKEDLVEALKRIRTALDKLV